jgi:hypothetical protein
VSGSRPLNAPSRPATFPAIALPGLDGVSRPLADAWGDGGALVAVGHSECRTTLLALPFVDRLHRRLRSRVLLVLQDEAPAARALVDELDLALPVRLEPDPYPLAAALRLVCVPTFYLVGAGGRLARVSEGFSRVELMALAEGLGLDEPLFTPDDDAPAFRPG